MQNPEVAIIQPINPGELSELLSIKAPERGLDRAELSELCSRLHDELHSLYPDILQATQIETMFIQRDCEEIVLSCLEYVKGFPEYIQGLPDILPPPLEYTDGSNARRIQQVAVPWGTVAAILPQSAFLYLALTCLLNGLMTGNRMILRAPAQSTQSAALLSLTMERSGIPTNRAGVILVSAREFMSALYDSTEPFLVHYLGSSAHAPQILSSCFEAGKQVIIDGEGNAWMWVDETAPMDQTIEILTSGAIRYNGETCTSINGAIIHPSIYEELKERLAARWNQLIYGNPLDTDVEVGPLLDEAQAEHCLTQIKESEAAILSGGARSGSLLTPTLAAEPRPDSKLVTEGLFGSALWIAPGDIDQFAELWKSNRYPLCAGVLSQSDNIDRHLNKLPNTARLVINGDPSIEYLYEPWGGYPASGVNPVSHWHQKYLRTVQVDCRI